MQEEVVIDSWVFPINRCLSERGRDLSMAVSLPVCRSTLSMKGPKCSSGDTPSLRGFRIEFAYQGGPYSLKLRGQLGVDLD
jgi:hypothetical protein